jgi:hypothetical protein
MHLINYTTLSIRTGPFFLRHVNIKVPAYYGYLWAFDSFMQRAKAPSEPVAFVLINEPIDGAVWKNERFSLLELGSQAKLLGVRSANGLEPVNEDFVWLGEKASRFLIVWSVLTLLAMPTIMVQATTTKNDLVVVFGVGCWLYSLVRFQCRQSKFFILTAALSLAFTAGSKTYAVAICGVLTVVTAWIWRKEVRTLLMFAGFHVPCVILFGSIETYVLSWQIYHGLLGPPDFVHDQKNRDGLRGFSANFLRYYIADVSFGVDGYAIAETTTLVARMLGFDRTGIDLEDAISDQIYIMVKSGCLQVNQGSLQLAL